MEKIITLGRLASIVRKLKKAGRKVVQCHGVFDLLHPGHIRHFEAARKQGDILIVTLTKDKFVNKGPGRPVFNQRLRAESIAALQCVDHVAPNEWPTATRAIKLLKPDVYAKGGDYRDPRNDPTGEIRNETEAARSVGGRVHFTGGLTFSSTKLLNAHFSVCPGAAGGYPGKFRKKYTAEQENIPPLVKYFSDLAGLFGRIEATERRRRRLELGGALHGALAFIKKTAARGRKILIIGNGGSASIASHMAMDFWKDSGIKALSFYDGAQLTRLGNDLGFGCVFEAPVKAFAGPGDLLIAVSSSGKSENILRGVRAARLKKCAVITLSGFRGDNPLRKLGDFNFYVPDGSYGFVETVHAAICHLFADHTRNNG